MVNPLTPFDIWDILVNELIGDLTLFLLIGIIAIVIYCMKNNFSFQATILSALFFIVVYVAVTLDVLLYVFILLSVGAFFFFMIARAIRRG